MFTFVFGLHLFFSNFAAMKKPGIHILSLLIAFALSLTGCHGVMDDDARLMAADSLLHHDADSALALLSSLDGSKLASAPDRAYHALLLTQARYKCYVAATSDSLINMALSYYQEHPEEREKLTRAYIYKGAVMEELGEGEQAMTHYKRALEVADPQDHFNQGYIRLRIGTIYKNIMDADNRDIKLLQEALQYFKQVPDSGYILACMSELGICYVKQDKDSALAYSTKAVELAKSMNEKGIEQTSLVNIAKLRMFKDNAHDNEAAKQIALSLVKEGLIDQSYSDDVLMIAAMTLARLNKPDSASLYLGKTTTRDKLPPGSQVFYDKCLAEIAFSRGDLNRYRLYQAKAIQQADSMASNSMQMKLHEVEAKYDNEALKYENLKYKSNLEIYSLLFLVALGALVITVLAVSLKSAKRKHLLSQSRAVIEQLDEDTRRLKEQLGANKTMNEDLKQAIRYQIDNFTNLVGQHKKQFALNPKQFGLLFQQSYSVNQPSSKFWDGIRAYADTTCNGIITSTLEQYPDLSEIDMRFLALCCCDLPTTVIMACMGYNDSHSVYNKKRRLAEAMGLTGKLDDYIQSFVSRKR